MEKQNSQNKILGGGEPNLRSKFGAKEFYFGYFVFPIATYFLLFIFTANAQFDLPTIGSIKPTISLSADPVTPTPGSVVAVSANISGLAGATGSSYSWFLNGVRQTAASGLNKNIFSFRVGAIGSIYRISVSVAIPTSGENLSDNVNLTVGNADITWITNSEAPVLYRAKLMPAQNSSVTVSALSSIYQPGTKTLISPNNLSYNWKLDGKTDSLKSGASKSSYAFRTSNFPGNPHLIELEIKTGDGAVLLNKNISVPVAKPQIFLYLSDPSTGLPFGAALKNLAIWPANLNFIAQPYYFSASERNLKWQWFMNNAEIGGETEKPWTATLNLADNLLGAFSAQIRVTAQNPNNELEGAESITNLEIR